MKTLLLLRLRPNEKCNLSIYHKHEGGGKQRRKQITRNNNNNNNINNKLFLLLVSKMGMIISTTTTMTCFIMMMQQSAAIASSSPSSLENGSITFQKNGCTGCHAQGGNIIESSKTLHVNDMQNNQIDSESKVYDIISLGKNRMPGYGEQCMKKGQCTFAKRLTEEELEDLSAFVWKTAQEDDGWTRLLETTKVTR